MCAGRVRRGLACETRGIGCVSRVEKWLTWKWGTNRLEGGRKEHGRFPRLLCSSPVTCKPYGGLERGYSDLTDFTSFRRCAHVSNGQGFSRLVSGTSAPDPPDRRYQNTKDT